MVIESIVLKNIKSYSAAEIHFKRGVNFIKGANGTGKTTLIEAVGFALFNVTSTGFAGGIHSYLLREGEREGEVRVRFSANGSAYEVKRTVSAEASRRKWQIFCDEEAAEGLLTDRDRVAFLQDAMGLPPDQKTDKLFTDMIGVRQGQFKAPFEYARRSRLEYFNDIFGVADFNRSWKNMGVLRKSIQAKRAELVNLAEALEGTIAQLAPKKKDLARIEKEMAALKEAFESLAAQSGKAKETYDLLREAEALDEKIALIRESGEKRIKEAEKTIRTATEELARARIEEQEALSALSDFGGTLAAMEEVKAALSAVRRDAAGVSDYFKGTAEKIAYERESVIKSLEEAKAEALKLDSGLCPFFGETCEKMQGRQFSSRISPLEDKLKKTEERFLAALMRPRNMQWDAHIRAYAQAAGKICEKLGVANIKTADAARAFEAFGRAEENPEALYAAIRQLEQDARRESEAFARHAEELAERTGEKNRDLTARSAAARKAAEGAQSRESEAEKRLLDIKSEMDAASRSEERRAEIKKILGENAPDVKSAQSEMLRISGEAGRAEEQIIQSGKAIESLKRDIAEMEETRSKIEEHKKREAQLARAGSQADLIADLFRRAGGRVAELYTRRISAFAARMYAQIAEDGAVLKFDTEYDAKLADIYKGKERIRSFNQLSGGQRMIVALCVRIAMLTCFAGLPIAFFDEPTENIDAEKKQNLAQNLRSNLGGFSQIFIISHDDAFDRLTENVIYLEETREGTVPAAL
jgi:exonuclease SbcC